MSPMISTVGKLCWVSLLVWMGAAVTAPAYAQSTDPGKDESCLDCHENLYLLHDSGKWYCMCESQARCTDCHGGVVGTVDVDVAHQGIIARPVQDDAAICKSCHPQDYQLHVDKFAAIGGIRPSPCPQPTYSPPAVHEGLTSLPKNLQPERLGPWQTAGISLAGLGLITAVIFAVRCCAEDRSIKENPE